MDEKHAVMKSIEIKIKGMKGILMKWKLYRWKLYK